MRSSLLAERNDWRLNTFSRHKLEFTCVRLYWQNKLQLVVQNLPDTLIGAARYCFSSLNETDALLLFISREYWLRELVGLAVVRILLENFRWMTFDWYSWTAVGHGVWRQAPSKTRPVCHQFYGFSTPDAKFDNGEQYVLFNLVGGRLLMANPFFSVTRSVFMHDVECTNLPESLSLNLNYCRWVFPWRNPNCCSKCMPTILRST